MLLRFISRLIGDIPLMCHIIPPCSFSHRIANERTGYIPFLRSLTDTVCDSCAVVPLYPLARGMYIHWYVYHVAAGLYLLSVV